MQRKQKSGFRLHLNLFDAIVVVLALIVGAVLIFSMMKPSDSTPAGTQKVRYMVQFNRWPAGTSDLIELGTTVEDGIKNYQIGKVVDVKAVQCTTMYLNEVTHEYVVHEIPGYEDVQVTLEADAVVDDENITIDGGYVIRVSSTVYGRGEGYVGIGPVMYVEREGLVINESD